jgi:hypothetical protein
MTDPGLEGCPRIPNDDPLLAALIREHGPEGRPDLVRELRPDLWRDCVHPNKALWAAAAIAAVIATTSVSSALAEPPGWNCRVNPPCGLYARPGGPPPPIILYPPPVVIVPPPVYDPGAFIAGAVVGGIVAGALAGPRHHRFYGQRYRGW